MSGVEHNQVGGKKKGLDQEEYRKKYGVPKRKESKDVGAAKTERTIKVKPAKMPTIKYDGHEIDDPRNPGKKIKVKPAKMPTIKYDGHEIDDPRNPGKKIKVKPVPMPDIKIPDDGYSIRLPKGFKKGSLIKGFPKLAKKGWK